MEIGFLTSVLNDTVGKRHNIIFRADDFFKICDEARIVLTSCQRALNKTKII